MRKLTQMLMALSLAVFVVGCASEPPKPAAKPIFSGEQMLRESQGMAQLGSRWQQGKQKVEQGQALQRDGQAKIDAGQTLIDEGQKIMRESEEAYKTIKQ